MQAICSRVSTCLLCTSTRVKTVRYCILYAHPPCIFKLAAWPTNLISPSCRMHHLLFRFLLSSFCASPHEKTILSLYQLDLTSARTGEPFWDVFSWWLMIQQPHLLKWPTLKSLPWEEVMSMSLKTMLMVFQICRERQWNRRFQTNSILLDIYLDIIRRLSS